MAGNDKLIGVLRLDLSQLSADVEKANKLLKSLGQGVNIDLSAEVMKAVEQKLTAITRAAENYGKKMGEAGQKARQGIEPVTSAIASLSKSTTTFDRVTGSVRTVAEGFDTVGRKITEVSNKMGQITSQRVTAIFDPNTDASKINELVSLYKKLGEANAKLTTAYGTGRQNETAYWEQQAQAIQKVIDWILRNNTALAKNEQVIRARAAAVEAVDQALAKQIDLEAKAGKATGDEKVRELVSLYQQLGQIQAKMTTAYSTGKTREGAEWERQAQAIEASIAALVRENNALMDNDKVKKAVVSSADAVTAAIARQADAEANAAAKASQTQSSQAQAQQIRELVSLYHEYAQARSKSIAAESAGKENEAQTWSQQAAALREKIMALEQANTALVEHPKVVQAAQDAEDQLALAHSRAADAMERERQKVEQQNTTAKQAEETYKQLKTAVSDYQHAMKSGSESGMAEASARVETLRQQIPVLEESANALDKESKEYREIVACIERMKTEYNDYLNLVNHGTRTPLEDHQRMLDGIKTGMSSMMGMLVNFVAYRGLRKFWSEAKSFATEYYNTLKEIQVVTQSTDAEMEVISQNFRDMASSLNVSMTDIAKGATIFFRQGLSTEETESRLTWATKFSKISGSSLDETAQYLTAVLNSMQSLNGDAQRVVDVFTYMGDNAATSGAEIATAMQKAAATADNAGMEFEFLAAAIASVSATTRQAPEAIGTAFNTMMARLHSIKQRGYNEEDETKINDVAKALNSVGIALMDTDGQWKDFDQILTEISTKWDTMTDKQRSYIATTMAGVRAQNYFIALMNDMSKGMEGGSTMWSLYQGAKGSEGIVNSKYETWLTGVEAAQNRLTLAVEKFYDALNTGNVFTGLFGNLAQFVDLLARGAEATNGWVVAGGALIAVIIGIGHAVKAAGGIGALFTDLMRKNPVGMYITVAVAAIALVTALVGGISDLVNAINTYKDSYDDLADESKKKLGEVTQSVGEASKAQQEFVGKARDIESLKDRYVELSTKTKLTADEEKELKDIISQIIDVCPGLRSQINQTTGAFENQTTVLSALNDEIIRNYRLAQMSGQHTARTETFGLLAEAGAGIGERTTALQTRQGIEDAFAVFLNNLTDEQKSKIDQKSTETGWTFEKAAFSEYINEWIRSELPKHHGDKDLAYQAFADMYGVYYGLGSDKYAAYDEIYDAHKDYNYDRAQLEKDTDDLVASTKATLAFFEDTMGLSSGVLENANKEAENIYNEVEQTIRSGQLTSDYLSQKSEEIQRVYSDAQAIQTQVNEDANLNLLQGKAETARSNYERLASGEGTSEEIKTAAREYNEAAKAFNDAYKNASKTNNDIYSLIAEDAVNLSKASDLVAQEEVAVDDVVARRKALRIARTTGFSEQREFLMDALFPDGSTGPIDKATYTAAAKRLQQNSPDIWNAMMQDSDFATMHKNITGLGFVPDSVIKDQARSILAATDHWKEATQAANQYYETVADGAEKIETDEEAAEALSNAYQSGGIEGVVDKYNALLEANDEFMTSFMDRHPEIAALFGSGENGETVPLSDFDIDTWLAELNALIPGTVENFSSLTGVIANTASTAEETIDAIDRLMKVLSQGEDGQSLSDITGEWSALTKEQQKLLKSLGVDEAKFKGLKAGSKELKELKGNLLGLRTKNLESLNRVLSGTSKAVESLSKGTKEWTAYQKTLMSSVDNVTKMQGAYDIILDKSKKDTDEYSEAMKYLSQQTGLSTELLGTDSGLAMALSYIQNQTEIVQNSVAALANTLLSMSGINFDASQIVGGYIQLGAGADDAAVQVANLVNTTLKLLGAKINFVEDGSGGGYFSVTGVTGQSPTSKTNKSGGGGGGGGSKKNTFSDRLSKITSQMGRSVDKYKEMLERLSLYESMYSDQGELTNVLRVQEQRQQVLIDQQKAYEDIIDHMPDLIARAKDELKKYKEGTEEYSKAMSDLQGLEDSYADYTQELIKNRAEQLKNADAMRETREAIVVLESDLRNTIQSVIMDRKNREEASLSARISMEGDVLDAIKNRYEKERDEIMETTDLRIESLNKETDALSDALDERRRLAEDQDKMGELTELQDQYARIIADPTRAKEAKEIAKKISDLQEEIGWDTAEREVQAQQKAIDQQLESLEDYQESTNKYYDELLKDPRNFIEEYNRILSGTDAEIINWLTENSDNYVKATDASRKQLLQGWQDTLDELRMYTRTVWDEVEQIINLGDAGILQFLMGNSQEFREANAYGQADLIYQWQEMLRRRNAAYTDDFENQEYMEFTNTIYDWVTYLISQSKSSGGGGGKSADELKKKIEEVSKKIAEAASKALEDAAAQSGGGITQAFKDKNANTTEAQKEAAMAALEDLYAKHHYASGGLAYGTGLAVLDGTAGLPERVLSPQQTAAFERLVDYITSPATVNVPGLRGGMIPSWSNGSAGAVFGDINISVESLDSDTDINNLADKIMDAIDERMTRGMVVGGVAMGY